MTPADRAWTIRTLRRKIVLLFQLGSMGDKDSSTGTATGATQQKANRPMSGLFRDRESAESAYRSLQERGYTKDDVNVLMSEETRKKHFSDSELGTKALEGAAVGAAVGGVAGATLAALAAIGTTFVLPGLGLVIAGPIIGALAGGSMGALTGGLVGALVGYGIPEEEAKEYEQGIREGGVVLIVVPRSVADADALENEWRGSRGEAICR
jgi:hypothetical protein